MKQLFNFVTLSVLLLFFALSVSANEKGTPFFKEGKQSVTQAKAINDVTILYSTQVKAVVFVTHLYTAREACFTKANHKRAPAKYILHTALLPNPIILAIEKTPYPRVTDDAKRDNRLFAYNQKWIAINVAPNIRV